MTIVLYAGRCPHDPLHNRIIRRLEAAGYTEADLAVVAAGRGRSGVSETGQANEAKTLAQCAGGERRAITMICDTCEKRCGNKCAVLVGKLPVWGPECSAYTDDPDWQEKVEEALKRYQKKDGGAK